MNNHKEAVVIGTGSGGLTVAVGLAKLGYKTTVIEKGYIGGDCTNFGCVPSKALLHRAHEIGLLRKYGLHSSQYNALEETRENREEFRHHESEEWLTSMGIELIQGYARFENNKTISIYDNDTIQQTISFDVCTIATGSRPVIPAIEGLESVSYLTNETIFELKKPPSSMIIIGAGPIGIEMADAFNNLGTKVTVINRGSQILSRSDSEIAEMARIVLQNEGIEFKQNATNVEKKGSSVAVTLKDGSVLTADTLLVAVGRQPNINLDLDKARINHTDKGITVNKNLTTNVSNIFAVGDCCNVPRFTHMAGYMGRTLVTNLAIKKYLKLPLYPFKYNSDTIPAVTFSNPEIAEAGLTEAAAVTKYGKNNVRVYRLDLTKEDRLLTQHHERGLIKLVTVGPFAQIKGVHIISKRAGEILPEFQLMMAKGMRIKDLGQFIRAYPTYLTRVDHLKLEWLTGLFKRKKSS
jgi:pyruvate/2-oxoglutarate dehydrogenase complex dihydrolipoamide dehydrogenase (E3) component